MTSDLSQSDGKSSYKLDPEAFRRLSRMVHVEQFICVAFQNRMAASIHGVTLHAGADLPRPGENRDRKLSHSEIDNLYMQNSSLRWVLLDEISMVADSLLDDFEMQFSNAERKSRYTKRREERLEYSGDTIS